MNIMTEKPTKATSKAERRRKSRAANRAIKLAGGDAVQPPPCQGQRPPQEDARTVALAARMRVYGLDDTKAAMAALAGSGAGLCITALAKDVPAISDLWASLSASQHNYRTRVLGLSGNPKGSNIAMLPEPMQTDTGHSIDTRTPDERDAAAKRSWLAWTAAIKALPVLQYRWAIHNALDGGINGLGGDVWQEGKPTYRGVRLVKALEALVALGGK